jgi:eukaryotic-like serine/threonine-protein kinase
MKFINFFSGSAWATTNDGAWLSESVLPDLVDQFAEAWGRGECPSVERFLAGLAPSDVDEETTVRLIYEEMCLRRASGRAMTSDEIRSRFPEWQSKLERLLDCERLLAPPPAASGFPEVGDEIGPFRLLAELGRGAVGRVFLAAQPALSDRPVVVKLTPQRGVEHLSLARLQHTGIVPLYLAQEFPERRMRLLCMPYVGGVTLARLLDALAAGEATGGRDVARIIENSSRESPAAVSHHGPALQFLQRASYVQSVCWIGACLADALHYAHQRGLAHFDVKPSNVLLAGDGQPMLLDFHLARGPLRAGERQAWLGGTPGYMSPEQEAALAALRGGREAPAAVDHRSDIYSLGVLLDEMRRVGKRGAPRLEAIVRKCLARSPDDRPKDAAELALELRRTLAERTAELDQSEGVERRARLPTAALLLAMILIAAVSGSVATVRLRQARTEIARLEQEARTHTHRERAQRLARNLHEVTDRLRWLVSNPSELPPQRLEACWRPLWERRRQFLDAARALAPSEQAQVRQDLLDLPILWAELAPRERRAELLAEAEEEFDGNPLLAFLANRSETPTADQLPAMNTPWEHYVVGRTLLRDGRLASGYEILKRGAIRTPGDFWLQFTLGECAARLGRSDEALAAWSACTALAPERPEPRLRRAAMYRELGRENLAILDEEYAERLAAIEPP